MLFLYTILGVGVYILTRWSVEFNKTQETGKTVKEWKHWCFTEINEWVISFVGALVFYAGGEGIYFGLIEAFEMNYDKWSDVYIELEVFYHIIGGALGGTLLLLLFKLIVKKVKKKVKEI